MSTNSQYILIGVDMPVTLKFDRYGSEHITFDAVGVDRHNISVPINAKEIVEIRLGDSIQQYQRAKSIYKSPRE